MPNILWFIIIAAVIAVAGVLLFLILKAGKKSRMMKGLDLRLLLVRLSKQNVETGSRDFKDEVNLSAQLFAVLSSLNKPFALEVSVPHFGEEISFYIGVPKDAVEPVSRQIEGLFKDAQVYLADDYNVFNSQGDNAGIFLKQKASSAIPLRTYAEAGVDTFLPLLSGLSRLSEVGEGAAVQILVRPANSGAKKHISQIIARLKGGAKLDDVAGSLKIELKDFKNAINPQTTVPDTPKMIDDEAIKAMEAKISKPLFEVNFRVAVSAPTPIQSSTLLDGIVGGISQFSAPKRQELQIIKPKKPDSFFYKFSFREFDEDAIMILNSEEIASLYHFPTAFTDIPRINWLKSKEAAPPTNMAVSGTMIGETSFRNQHKPVYISEDDRRRHVYIIGQTGTGKTNLMMNMAIDDIKNGKGVCIIDPHGEDAESVLSVVPKERLKDVVIFDPADLEKPVGMNMLEYDFSKPEQKTFVVNEMYSILDKLYDMKTAGGPMFELYMKNALLLLMEDAPNEPGTLMEVRKIFVDDAYREKKLSRIYNTEVINFWRKEASAATGEHSLSNMSAYITSKFNNFTTNDFMRPIIGQAKSAFDFRKIMDEQKILLILLSKGRIGDLNANLLGMILIGKILMAALSRVDMSQEERKDFNLYVDEFQNFTTDSTSTILSEARKYRLNLTMGHQFIAQLPEKIRDSVFGNVGNKIVFRVSPSDADFLVKEFEPTFNQKDLTNISNGNAYVKILVNGQTTKPFNIRTHLKPKGNRAVIAEVKELSRQTYGKDRREIEEDILKRSQS